MFVAGVDFSTHYIDIVLLSDGGLHQWDRFALSGSDAFERTRDVAEMLPGRHHSYWDDVLAVGVEEPQGGVKSAVGKLKGIQGAILACIPPQKLVHPWMPAGWRKAVGLAGNAPKDVVAFFAVNDGTPDDFRDWPQDACDAYCIALATRGAVSEETGR